jgi:threonine/homoserine/homoserine lactone efflux protein
VTWPTYGAFVIFSVLLILIPGPDFAVVVRAALAGGRRAGRYAAIGVAGAAATQGLAAAFGLGAVVATSRPVFVVLTWVGAAYLVWLGLQALRSAWRGRYPPLADGPPDRRAARTAARQGYLSNITNPKVIAFYLAVLPQFLTADATVGQAVALALTHAVLSLAYLVALAAGVQRASRWLGRRSVRRSMEATTGLLLLTLAGRLALDG